MLGVLMMCGMLLFGCGRAVGISPLDTVEFSYSRGAASNDRERFTLCWNGGRFVGTAVFFGEPDEDIHEFEADEADMREIEELFRRYGVGRWNGFSKNNRYVLDGSSFSLKAVTGGAETIEARGYARYPKNFREVREGLEEIFGRLCGADDEG